jgi:hypothetical protein
MDFAKLVEVFDRNNVTFVSVTQSFNTTTSMGRLTLNILLSFAQFEREVIGERIRDKFAASRKKGMWMGGFVPLGYDVKDRKLVLNPAEAGLVRHIFKRFLQLGSVTVLVRELHAEKRLTKRGKPFDKGIVYKLLNNRVYIGEAVHKGTSYPGEHAAIIDRETFENVKTIFATNGHQRTMLTRSANPALLRGLIFTAEGRAMTPRQTRRGSKLYRYYVSTDTIRGRQAGTQESPRLPADMVESAVVREIRRLLRAPEIVARATTEVRRERPSATERDVVTALDQFHEVWAALFPAEQARIVRLLVERVTVTAEGLAVDLRGWNWSGRARDACAHAQGGRRMIDAPDTIRIVIPLKMRRRNGRPRILPPDDSETPSAVSAQDPHLVHAIARAWKWRRQLERGDVTTIDDIATAEKVSDRFVSRTLRLVYLSPTVLEMLLIHRRPCALSIKDLIGTAKLPRSEQAKITLGD